MATENPDNIMDRINYHALLMVVREDILKALPEWRLIANFACSPEVPAGTKFETSFDREKGYTSFVETWDEGGKRELIIGAGGEAWDLTLEVHNTLTPTKIVARKDWKGKITFESLPIS